MPTLDWIGKDKVINHHMDVPYRVLDIPEDTPAEQPTIPIAPPATEEPMQSDVDDFSDIAPTDTDIQSLVFTPTPTISAPPEIADMISHAEKQSDEYETCK